MAIDTAPIGSVGHLVGATLETVGHFLQGQLLDLFSPSATFGKSLGLLFWVASALIGLTFYIYTGKSKLTLSFLLGPVLFFFFLGVRTTSQGAEWRFGTRTYERGKVVASAVETTGKGDPQTDTPRASVSWFFSLYDRIVSGVVQTLVSAVEYVSRNGTVSFLTKAERYERLFRPTVADGSLKWFISGVMIPNCSDYFMRMRGYLDPNENILNREEIRKTLQARGKSIAVTKADHPEVFEWLEQERLYPYALQEALSCDDLWKAGVQGLLPEATQYVETTLQRDLPEGYEPEQLRDAFRKKFSKRYVATDGASTPLTSDQQFMLVLNEVAGRMLLTEVKTLQPDLLNIHFGSDAPPTQGGLIFNQQFATRSLRRVFQTDVGEEKGDYLMSTLSLPYVQGMMLMFLAVAFPFAALVSVIPGKHTAVILWMGLWLWAKSWDVGFAVVMLVDDILFQLFPHGNPISGEVLATPWEAMKALSEVDPAYSVYTYYHLLATCLAAVPLLTGLFIKRAGGQVMDSVKGSLSTFAGKLGGTVAAYRAAALTQTQVARTMQDIYSTAERAMANARFDPIVSEARKNALRAMVDTAANNAAGAPGAAALSEAALNMHVGKLAARMSLLEQTAFVNATASDEATYASVDAIVSNFNSHDLIDRDWVGDALIESDKVLLSPHIASGTTPLFAGGLSLTNTLFGNQYTDIGRMETYLRQVLPRTQESWSPETLAEQITRLNNGEDITAPGVVKTAYGPRAGDQSFINRRKQP